MQLIIFDCDGTLVDSERLCNLALERQLAEVGLNYSADYLIDHYRGVKFTEILTSIQSESQLTFPDSFETQYRLKVSDLFDQQLTANDGVAEVLESLTLPFCIASSAPRAKIEHALNVTGLMKYFDNTIFSAHEVGAWKPDPDLFLHAAKTMGVEPEACCVVEDSLVGLQATHRAGMTSVYYAPHQEDIEVFGSVHIQHMSQLLKVINMSNE
ncbi:HAD family hydrolase [Vibrio sp. 10N.222.51.C12]|uniref:HAD family hydrolase n=1 Tax=unclassified Vibrio TaxID=2614977 RepID=UPI000C84EAB6|nr:HAD family hydrolase [Vibrio sp. 10N.286.48.B7]PMH78815.1 haloacid dehalogenase [Vibrio sp. 10N.286.48.B7]